MAAVPAAPRWFFGPAPDLLLGCGLAYAVVFGAHALLGAEMRALFPLGLLPFAVLLSGVPHYGATLLRVYERREDRRRYVVFSVFATIAVFTWFSLGVYDARAGSLMLTVYLTWSPWHYSGQNYGIALMFLGRRNVRVTPLAKRLIHLSFLFSFASTVLAVHGTVATAAYAPLSGQSQVFEMLRLGIPQGALRIALGAVALAYAASLVGAATLLLREARLRDLGPAAAIAATQALWFTVPVFCRYAGTGTDIEPLSLEHAAYAFVWIGIGHGLQYLWVTTWYAKRSGAERSKLRYWSKALLAGAAIWILPVFVFAPGVLGRVPYSVGLQVLIASAVNIHHFILDGAIWKLRDGAIARVLIRGQSVHGAREPGRPWLRAAIYAAGAASVAVWVIGDFEREFGVRRAAARGDVERLERAHGRLGWLGQASAEIQLSAARGWAERGDLPLAIGRAQSAIELHESTRSWSVLAELYERAQRCDEAEAAYRAALALEPDALEVANNLAWQLATHEGTERSRAEAVALAERAAADGHPAHLDTLAAAYAAAGRGDLAARRARRALRAAETRGDEALAREIEQHLSRLQAGQPIRAHP